MRQMVIETGRFNSQQSFEPCRYALRRASRTVMTRADLLRPSLINGRLAVLATIPAELGKMA